MKHIILLLYFTLIFVFANGGRASKSLKNEEILNQFLQGYQDLSTKFYQEITKSKKGNLITSPLSAQIILSLVATGANGNTLEELIESLDLPKTIPEIAELSQLLKPNLNKKCKDGFTISSANNVYVQKGFTIKPDFRSIAIKTFDAEVKNIDFSQSRKAAQIINQWVDQKTNHKIYNLIDPTMLDSSTKLVLVNALYFMGQWKHKFKKSNNKLPFYSYGKSKLVDMMRATEKFRYKFDEKLDAEILEMGYTMEDASMVIVLPKQRDGLAGLEEQLPKVLASIDGTKIFRKVNVILPKFKLESTIELIPILQEMGIRSAFNGKADFSGISDEKLVISTVIQKAFIDVSENGTEAAASTAVGMSRMAIFRPRVIDFKADHPFMFFIRLNLGGRGLNLFTGKFIART